MGLLNDIYEYIVEGREIDLSEYPKDVQVEIKRWLSLSSETDRLKKQIKEQDKETKGLAESLKGTIETLEEDEIRVGDILVGWGRTKIGKAGISYKSLFEKGLEKVNEQTKKVLLELKTKLTKPAKDEYGITKKASIKKEDDSVSKLDVLTSRLNLAVSELENLENV